MSEPTRYPLAWPAGRPRTPAVRRKPGQFVSGGARIGVHVALDRLDAEIHRLGGVLPVLSTDYPIRLNGQLDASRAPADPGACVYFQLKGKPYAMACDTFASVAQNVAALAAHIEATRRIERYGVASAAETLQAFQALPPPEGARPVRPWREVFGVGPGALERDEFDFYFKRAMKKAHPDTGGTTEAAAEVTAARAAGMIEMGWKL